TPSDGGTTIANVDIDNSGGVIEAVSGGSVSFVGPSEGESTLTGGAILADDELSSVFVQAGFTLSDVAVTARDSAIVAISGALDNTGSLVAQSGGSISVGNLDGTGSVIIDGGQIFIEQAASDDVTVDFTTAQGGQLFLADPTDFSGHISGFARNDNIDL